MKKLLTVILGLLLASAAFAVDNPISCSGASCKVIVKSRDGSGTSQTIGSFNGDGTFSLGLSSPSVFSNQINTVNGRIKVNGSISTTEIPTTNTSGNGNYLFHGDNSAGGSAATINIAVVTGAASQAATFYVRTVCQKSDGSLTEVAQGLAHYTTTGTIDVTMTTIIGSGITDSISWSSNILQHTLTTTFASCSVLVQGTSRGNDIRVDLP